MNSNSISCPCIFHIFVKEGFLVHILLVPGYWLSSLNVAFGILLQLEKLLGMKDISYVYSWVPQAHIHVDKCNGRIWVQYSSSGWCPGRGLVTAAICDSWIHLLCQPTWMSKRNIWNLWKVEQDSLWLCDFRHVICCPHWTGSSSGDQYLTEK